MSGVTVGQVSVFEMVIVAPAGAALPAGVIPQWTSSDVTTATVESPNSDATGLTVKVTGVKAGSFTLTCAITNPANNNVVEASVALIVVEPPPPFPTQIGIQQVS